MANKRDWKGCTDDKEKYQLYLASREWCKLREQVRERSGGKCERCETLPMEACHHLTYKNKYKESLEDLQAICTPCHEFTHGKSDFDPVPNGRFISWLKIFPEHKPWLAPGLAASILRDLFTYPTLIPVFQLWVTVGVSDYAAEDALSTYGQLEVEPGVLIEDCGVHPNAMELKVWDMFDDQQRMFWSWLRWYGPSEIPIGSKEAFDKCVELSLQMTTGK